MSQSNRCMAPTLLYCVKCKIKTDSVEILMEISGKKQKENGYGKMYNVWE
jgi:hypothetical protein